jgi:hypothetical protein
MTAPLKGTHFSAGALMKFVFLEPLWDDAG